MKGYKDLQSELKRIDGRGYKAYKDIQGKYKFERYILSIDYVQGDPFASPSRIRVILDQNISKIPQKLFDKEYKRIAVVDFLTRLTARNINAFYERVKGSGKSGLLAIDRCGQEVIDRTSIKIDRNALEVRLEVGLPAAGRRVLSKEADEILFNALPKIIEESLIYENIHKNNIEKHVKLAEDQYYIRQDMKKRGIAAFIADRAILPRESGISQRPMKVGAVPFKAPDSLKVEFDCPHRGKISGMGIKEGVTLIVGGGYHGKSTLLRALELGVYNHIEGDGREFVLTNDNAVKIRAEDGRKIEKVNITPFINNLPNGKDTVKFSSENASGSTSQSANIIEAVEVGCDLLLIDEDTSATNFMIRDKKMQILVSQDKEPITPFIDRVRELYENHGVSSIIVVGSSGDYFGKANTIIMMDDYEPLDVTEKAISIFNENRVNDVNEGSTSKIDLSSNRVVLKSSFPKGIKGIKVKSKGLNTILYNKSSIILDDVEQLASVSQTNCIASIIKYIAENQAFNNKSFGQIVDDVCKVIDEKGLDNISELKGHPGNLARPRRFEIAAALNRFRELKIK